MIISLAAAVASRVYLTTLFACAQSFAGISGGVTGVTEPSLTPATQILLA